jgi:ADP-heptose:LPS heptosyltransferase
MPFDWTKAVKDTAYRAEVIASLRRLDLDLCLHTAFSRSPTNDRWALECGARELIAFRGNSDNISPEELAANNARYTRLIDTSQDWFAPELDRYRDFLLAIGATAEPLVPQVWTSAEDREQAMALLEQHGIKSGNFIAMFAGGADFIRNYDGFGKALATICRSRGFHVIALGAEREREINQKCLEDVGSLGINLCGRVSLRQSIEIIRTSRLAVGTETGLGHIAVAVGTPNVILLGGGKFGRFMPSSPLTSAVTLPLSCFGCSWQCHRGWAHCVKDVAPEAIELAINEALDSPAQKMRVYFQDDSLWSRFPTIGGWMLRADLLKNQPVDYTLVAANAKTIAPDAPGMRRVTVVRRFHRPHVLPWLGGSVKVILRPLVRALRNERKL